MIGGLAYETTRVTMYGRAVNAGGFGVCYSIRTRIMYVQFRARCGCRMTLCHFSLS